MPFLYVSCVRDGKILWDQAAQISDQTFQEISKGREPERGMVLYTAVGSFGHAAVVCDDRKFAFQRHVACIYPNDDLDSSFLAMWLESAFAKRHGDRVAIGNAQRTVTLGALVLFPVMIPSLAEQRRLVEVAHVLDLRRVQLFCSNLDESNIDHLTSLSFGRKGGSGLGTAPSA